MPFETIPSPGLEPPMPRLVIVPDRRICGCGKPLQSTHERQRGTCDVCDCLDLLPLFPCAGDLFPLMKGTF